MSSDLTVYWYRCVIAQAAVLPAQTPLESANFTNALRLKTGKADMAISVISYLARYRQLRRRLAIGGLPVKVLAKLNQG
jgi:hypothetical protein